MFLFCAYKPSPVHGAWGAIPGRPSGVRAVADRADPGMGRRPRRWLSAAIAPGGATGAGRVSEAGVRPGGSQPGGVEEMPPAPTPLWADPEQPADPPTTRRAAAGRPR